MCFMTQTAFRTEPLSEQVGLSRNAVWKRIRTMEQNGVIASRVAILDAAAFDLNLTVFIQLKTASHSKDGIKRLGRTCKLLPQVQGAYRWITYYGQWCGIFRITIASIRN